MIRFGFSAFLKLLSLNDKPQRTEIRRRLAPSSGGGYDFHDSLRRLAHRYLVDGDPMPDLLASAGQIVQPPERLSALAALERLAIWRDKNPGLVLNVAPVTYESPHHLFKVEFKPDFSLLRHGNKTAIHIWNTQNPELAPGAVYAALTLIAQTYENEGAAPDDLGVLSLREPTTLYLLSEAADWSSVAETLVERIEDIIQGPALPPPQPEDRPGP